MRILVLNGPNLNMIGIREPSIYGQETYEDLCNKINKHCASRNIDVEIFQSNHEGDLIDKIQNSYNKISGIIINAGAYSHTSIAILDALKAIGLPAIEVHISDVYKREEFRHFSYPALYCKESIVGEGTDGYLKAIDKLINYIEK